MHGLTQWIRAWRLSLFEKVILVNSIMLIAEGIAGLWLTSHNLETHHYLIDTSFIVVATLLTIFINIFFLRASFRPLFHLLTTIRAVSTGETRARVNVSSSSAEIVELGSAFNTMLDRLETVRREQTALIFQAQEDERKRISLELHDEAGQNLTALLRILLADDHDILRQGLKLLFEVQSDIQVVGEARTGLEAIEEAKKLSPDVVVMDITMAKMNGLTACQHIRQKQPEIQVLILTMHESEEYFLQALRVGAAGYLMKKAAPAELSAAVRTIAQGGAYLYPGLAKTLIRAYVTMHTPQHLSIPASQYKTRERTLAQTLDVLTPRELEVLTSVAEGYTNQEIADLLVLSIKTVQAHRANVMEKLGLHDITHLVRFAIHHGLISPEP